MSTASPRLNILVVTPWYPMAEHPYFGVFVREYARAVQKFSNVTVLHIGIAEKNLKQGWSIRRESDPELTAEIPCYRVSFQGRIPSLLALPLKAAGVAQAVARVNRQHGPFHLIHSHVFITSPFSLLISRCLGIPWVLSEHFSGFPRRTLSMFQRGLVRATFYRADVVLPVSRYLQSAIEQIGVTAKFRVIPNTVDAHRFYPVTVAPCLNRPFQLISIGSLIPEKGLSILFQSLRRISLSRPWHLDVVGDGPERQRLEKLAEELEFTDQITFCGALKSTAVASMLQKADLFVLPSLGETFSVATVEALFAGIPVLVTRSGGPEDFVDASCGLIVPPNDPVALAVGIEKMLERLDDFDRAAISQQAQGRFGHDVIGSTLTALYHELINSRNCRQSL